MKPFFNEDFLLTQPAAKGFFQAIAGLPVVDFFCKLNPTEIAENRHFENITQLLLTNDAEKLQAMRLHGIDEYYISGEAGDYEKFQKFAETIPCLLGNPLYHRTHLELNRYFHIVTPLSPATVEQIWNNANEKITKGNLCVYEIFKKFHVEAVHIPENITASLDCYQGISENGLCPAKVFPAFCPDRALYAKNKAFTDWTQKMEECCSTPIETLSALQICLTERLLYFKSIGTRTSVHTVDFPYKKDPSFEKADAAFQKAKRGLALTPDELIEYQSSIFCFLVKKYRDYGFTLQIQIRNQNNIKPLIALLEQLNQEQKLPKIIISAIDAMHYKMLAKIIAQSKIAGSIRMSVVGMSYQKDALHSVLQNVATYGILPDFAGFSSGSSRVLSYSSQEYFRRVLCEFLGTLVENGEYPNYQDLLKKFATDISYENTKLFF